MRCNYFLACLTNHFARVINKFLLLFLISILMARKVEDYIILKHHGCWVGSGNLEKMFNYVISSLSPSIYTQVNWQVRNCYGKKQLFEVNDPIHTVEMVG